MASPLAKNNAFGVGCASWNLPFPTGNLTAVEILAYLPHWLKSVDVIDRFVTNGGKSYTIAAIINEFRDLPGDGDGIFRPNSAQIMMSYGMRRAGFTDWTVGAHSEFPRPNPGLLGTNLNVQGFRTPRETHPKSAGPGQIAHQLRQNEAADPMEFKDLARHVRIHPIGSDALDLARCVQYAFAHPDEEWYFPDDFGALVNKLGGPATVTHYHLDRQIFERRKTFIFPSPAKSTPRSKGKRTPTSRRTYTPKVMPQSWRFTGRAYTPPSGSPLKRMMGVDGTVEISGRRKSGRLANKGRVNLRDHDSDDTDKDDFDSPASGYSTPAKKRKICRLPPTPGSPSNDSDFHQDGSEPDEDIPEVEDISEDELGSPVRAARGRAAARKARHNIHTLTTETQRNIEKLKASPRMSASPRGLKMLPPPVAKPVVEVSQEMMSLARAFSDRQPVFLQPPVLSANRLRVDSNTIYLYAAEGCTTPEEIWNTALSSTRFNGPRRHPPFRELHRLTDPFPHDVSEWAENIRWAKEQHATFGSETWTEYDYHLELITTHRREVLWASEEAITGHH